MGVEDVSGFLMGLATGTLMGGALGFMFLAGSTPPIPVAFYQPQEDVVYQQDPRARHRSSAHDGHRYHYDPRNPYTPPPVVKASYAGRPAVIAQARDGCAPEIPEGVRQRHQSVPMVPLGQQAHLSELAAKAANVSREYKDRQKEYFDLREQIRELQKLDISAKINETAGPTNAQR